MKFNIIPSKSKKNKLKKSQSQSNDLSFSSVSSFAETPKTVLLPPSSHFSSSSAEIIQFSSSSSSDSSIASARDVDVVEVFKIFDRNNDGKISQSELELLFHRLGFDPPSQDEVVMMLQEADLDGDGYISLEEFEVLSSKLGSPPAAELRDAFDYFDSDKDGKISAEELLEVFSTLGDEGCTLDECRRMIGKVDADGKGFVGFEDFVRMMEGQR